MRKKKNVLEDLINEDTENFILKKYNKDLKKCPPLKREEERQLMMDYKTNNNLIARQKLIMSNLRYVCTIVNSFKDKCEDLPLSDLIEEANIGLIEGIDKYDLNYDVKVITYASHQIRYRLSEYIEKNHRILFDKNLLVENCGDTGKLVDDTSTEELCLTNEAKIIIKNLLNNLDENDCDMIKMRYGIDYSDEYTLEDIGRKYGVTKERARVKINKIMRKLRVEALKSEVE